MRDFKILIDKLLLGATNCDLIGERSVSATRQATLHHLSKQFRDIARQLVHDPQSAVALKMSGREFLLSNAEDFRELASIVEEIPVRDTLLAMAEDFEQKARGLLH